MVYVESVLDKGEMKMNLKIVNLVLILMIFSLGAFADTFQTESQQIAQKLKMTMMKSVSEKVSKEGTEKAISFCHENIKEIAKSSVKEFVEKYEFGRTSDKTRNKQNKSLDWMIQYLDSFKASKAQESKSIIHLLPSGKRVYLEPIYIQPICLNCHGENIKPSVKMKLKELYPEDQAIDYKLGEFRGFIWVKEK
jgi:hypothetical protein